MGLWKKGFERNTTEEKIPEVLDETVEVQEMVSVTSCVEKDSKLDKIIDWEERHFQICLAMLSCPVCNRHGHPDAPYERNVIARADKMVELLKKHHLKKENAEICPSVSNSEPVREAPVEMKSDKIFPQDEEFERNQIFTKIWQTLEDYGFSQGDDIPYQQFFACCDELNIDLDDTEVNLFSARYDVNIG